MSEIITVNHAFKRFGETIALDDITVGFEQGKIYGIIGRNGSGKTMLLKAICGFIPLNKGEIFVNEKQIGKDIDFPENIGIIIENPGFLQNYSGFNNLKILSKIKNQIGNDKIKDSMFRVGLNPANKKWVSKYSLGMRQRLGIAQAIMENPSIIILDEPTNGLDNEGVEITRSLLLQLKESGKTIIIASHNRDDVEILCDTVFTMDKGKIVNINTVQTAEAN